MGGGTLLLIFGPLGASPVNTSLADGVIEYTARRSVPDYTTKASMPDYTARRSVLDYTIRGEN